MKLLQDKKIVDDKNQSIATTNHNETVSALRDIEASMDANDEGVDSATYGTYSVAGDAYVDIERAVEQLQGTINDAANAPGASIDAAGRKYWPESVEGPLRTACAIVVARNGNSITTIEGNSGDAVRQHTYNLSSGNFTGVIHPPAKTPVNA